MGRRKRVGPNLKLNYQFQEKKNVYMYITILYQFKCWKYYFQALAGVRIAKLLWGNTDPWTSKMYLEQTKLVHLHLSLLGLFWIRNNFFILNDQCRFFIFGIGPDILMNVLGDCVIFLLWAVWALFNFILSKNKAILSSALLKMQILLLLFYFLPWKNFV